MERTFGRGRYLTSDDKIIGRGGFGRVFRAIDTNVQREVALKVLLAVEQDELRRFADEARTTSKLKHKNIVIVHDFGEDEGVPYLAMELLEGITLEALIDNQQSLSLLQKVETMQHVAEGLQYAHSQGVIHRDIKPSNIMVLNEGGVKIMDFGIARITKDNSTHLTQTGAFIGTAAYTAPERFAAKEADIKTDIFSFGVVFYEILSGANPFAAPNPAQSLYRVTTHDPPSLSSLNGDMPSALEHLVERLIMKEREERYATLDEVLIDTRPILTRLRQAEAVRLFEEVRPNLDTDRQPEIQNLIARLAQVLEFHEHDEARHWHNKLREEERRKASRHRVERLKLDAADHLAARRYREALVAVENALKFDKNDISLLQHLDDIKTTQDRSARAGRLLHDVRALEADEAFEEALRIAREAVELDPEHPHARGIVAGLERKLTERRGSAILRQAEDLRAKGMFDEALRGVAEISASDANAVKAEAFRLRVEKERAAVERQKRERLLQEELELAREDLISNRLEEARRGAERLLRTHGDQTSLIEFAHEVEEHFAARLRAERVRKAVSSANELIDQHRDFEAIVVLQDALKESPGDAEMERLLAYARERESDRRIAEQERTRSLQAQAEDRRITNEAVSKAVAIENQGQPQQALQVLQTLDNRLRQDQQVQQIADRLSRKIEEQEREVALALYERRIRAFALAKNWTQARSLLTAARREFPQHVAWESFDLVVDEGERLVELDAIRESVTKALSQDRFSAAREILESSAGRFQSEPAWQSLAVELENRHRYVMELGRATQAFKTRRYEETVDFLKSLVPGAPDERAQLLLETAQREMDQLKRQQIVAVERAKAAELAKGLNEARLLVKRRALPEAVDLLDRLSMAYPESVETQTLLRDVLAKLEKQEREERARSAALERRKEAAERARQSGVGAENAGLFGVARSRLTFVALGCAVLVAVVPVWFVSRRSNDQGGTRVVAPPGPVQTDPQPEHKDEPPIAAPSTSTPTQSVLTVSPQRLVFNYDGLGQPIAKILKINSSGEFDASSKSVWLSVTKEQSGSVRVEVLTAGLQLNSGPRSGEVKIRSSDKVLQVPVQLNIAATVKSAPIKWSGPLEPGASVSIRGSSPTIGMIGLPIGSRLVDVKIIDPVGVAVNDLRIARNGDTVSVRNTGSQKAESFKLIVESIR